MKIKNLRINNFGNLSEKEITLGDHMNIIQGKNESGKSTLLKFISNIFYGASKTKKGKEYSDYDRYKPWNQEEFSGKLTYTLDDGTQYEVFRDFNKKNPTIYNEQLEDISKQFTIDKTYGNQFFVEQTNVEETMFYSTLVAMQQEVKLEQNIQNAMVQKVANLAGTGDDSISYKKAIDKINKKQVEEIGTARSQGRPINVIKNEKFKLQDEIGELEEYKERKQEISKEKEEILQKLKEIENTIELIKKVKIVKEQEKLEKEKIKISQDMQEGQKQKIKELEQIKQEIKKQEIADIKEDYKEPKNNNKKISIAILVLSILFEIIATVLIKNVILICALAVIFVFSLVFLCLETKKQNNEIKKQKEKRQKQEKQNEEINNKLEEIEAQIKVLQNNVNEQEKEIENKKQTLYNKENIEKEKLKEYKNEIVDELFEMQNIQAKLENKEEEKSHKKLAYHSLELEENTINPKLEKIALLEEQLEDLKQKEEELEKDNEAIELTKQVLEIAYQKMKQNVTPKLTENLSENIKKISNEKYTKVSINEESGLVVEKENGEYIEAEKLSIGTIDQLYLSLRLAMVKEITKETMPIILDEAFAYYDEERLTNILKYLNSQFPNNQIIILTCTNREKEILNKNNIQYEVIEL